MIKNTILQYFADEHLQNTKQVQEDNLSENEQTPSAPKQESNIRKKEQEIPEALAPTDPELNSLYQECLACKACSLCETALNLVFGEGNPKADLMIIGEAPGADEDAQGRPFVGRAGQLLIKILSSYGMPREDIFIANILKHRPPNNRNPLPAEIQACTPFLKKQIALIQPKLLITLGNFASQFILDTKIGITKIRGTIHNSEFGMVMPSLHPSAIIRGAYPQTLLETDIATALEYIGFTIKEH
ncbi:MAG: uracil-DNA glycosylase [Brevinema sp.]